MSLSASAVDPTIPTGCHLMNLDELADILPESFDGQYLDGNYQFHAVTFTRSSYGTTSDVSLYCGGDRPYFTYTATINDSVDWEYQYAPVFLISSLGVQLSNVTYLSWRCGSWCNLERYRNMDMSDVDFPAGLHYVVDDTDFITYPLPDVPNGIHAECFRINGGWSAPYSCFLMEYQGDSTSIFFDDFTDVYLHNENNSYYMTIFSPIINDGYILGSDSPSDPDWGDGQSIGEVTGTIEDDGNGTQNINVTVNTDNSGLLSGLLNGLRSLFVPSQEYMNSWHADIEDSFSEHLGGVSEAVDLIDEQADYLRAATSADYIYFPELKLPIGSSGFSSGHETIGSDYVLIQGQQVELRPARTGKLKILWDFVEFAVDVVCVLAVFNMLQTKYEIFLNPDGEVITYDN